MKKPDLQECILALLLLAPIMATACSNTTRYQHATRSSTSTFLIKNPPLAQVVTTAIPFATTLSLPSEEKGSTSTPEQLSTPSSTDTSTPSPTPTNTPTLTITPTYAILRGEVLVRANCRYGPGAPYLYKYGLVAGSNLEIIGRTDSGAWILVRAIGGNNPCWVKASLLDVKGDVMAVQPTYIPLPLSPYYRPLKGVSARRDGDIVTVFWSPLSLRAGDDSEQVPYVIEAWVCVGGERVFTPVGAYGVAIEITDETGCSEPSHGRITAAEKHGYTPFVEIPWP